jgi:hypothetical protein
MPRGFDLDDIGVPEYRIQRMPDGDCVVYFRVPTPDGIYHTKMECHGRPRLPTIAAVKDSLHKGTRKFQLGGGLYTFHSGWHR